MSTFFKIIAASIVFAAASTTAQAAQSYTPNTASTATVQVAVQKSTVRKITRKVKLLPTAHSAAALSSRTVLFYDAQPTRSKVITTKPSKTSTPNLFK